MIKSLCGRRATLCTGFLLRVRAPSQAVQKQPDAAAVQHAVTPAAVSEAGSTPSVVSHRWVRFRIIEAVVPL